MPVISIEYLKGRSLAQKRALAEKVTDAVVQSLDCNRNDVHIVMRECEPDDIAVGGKLKSEL